MGEAARCYCYLKIAAAQVRDRELGLRPADLDARGGSLLPNFYSLLFSSEEGACVHEHNVHTGHTLKIKDTSL